MAVELKALVINVWSGLAYKGIGRMRSHETSDMREQRFQALVSELTRLQPDLIGLNEANPLPHYVTRLSNELGYDNLWHMGVSGLRLGPWGVPVNLREGDAILARHGLGLSSVSQRKLMGTGFVHKHASLHISDLTQAVLGRVRVEGRDVFVAVTHWHLTPRFQDAEHLLEELRRTYGYSERACRKARCRYARDQEQKRQEAMRLVAWLRRHVPRQAPLLVMGDFNARPDWPEMALVRASGLRDVLPAEDHYTWDPLANDNLLRYQPLPAEQRFVCPYHHLRMLFEKEPRRIDYILVNDHIDVMHAEICMHTRHQGVHASDHFGVLCRVRIR